MDNCDLVYFVNSQGEKVTLSSPDNEKYWELIGRSGFTAPKVDIFTEKFASGETRYFGKAKKPRTCKMKMFIRGKSTAERDKMFFDMLHILLDERGTGEGKLFVKKSDGQIVYLNCVYSAGMDIVEQYKLFHIFTLEFYGADPNFYLDKSLDIDYIDNGYDVVHYTKVPWSDSSYSDEFVSFRMDIINPCRWNVWPVIKLKYTPCIPDTMTTNLENETTEKTIQLYHVDNLGQRYYEDAVLTTDPKKRSVMAKAYVLTTNVKAFIPVPDLLNDDMTQLNFPLAPGKNTLNFVDWNDSSPFSYNLGIIDLKIPFDGV